MSSSVVWVLDVFLSSGLTMLDDALAVIECDSGDHLAFDSASPGISRRHLRQLYTKTVLIHLLREKPLPVYLTDFEAGAVKASVVSGPRGMYVQCSIYLGTEGEGSCMHACIDACVA